MRISCPSCGAQYSLDTAIQMDAAREALMRALQMPAPLARLWAQYLGLFRSGSRVLAFDRAERLMAELLPMLDSQTVTRNGLTRPAPLAIWQAALEQMVDLRNADKLKLPLKSHGYLLEIVFGEADRADARTERQQEVARRRGEHRKESAAGLDRLQRLSQVRGDFALSLIERAEAVRRLAELGYSEEALDDR